MKTTSVEQEVYCPLCRKGVLLKIEKHKDPRLMSVSASCGHLDEELAVVYCPFCVKEVLLVIDKMEEPPIITSITKCRHIEEVCPEYIEQPVIPPGPPHWELQVWFSRKGEDKLVDVHLPWPLPEPGWPYR